MNKFNRADFVAYFEGSWIVSPSLGRPVQVHGADDDNNIVTVYSDSGQAVRHLIPFDSLEWYHCAYPEFGYVNWPYRRQRLVVLAEKLPHRTMLKGLNRRTTRLMFPEGYYAGNREFLSSIPLQMDQAMVEALYSNTYPTLANAIRYMEAPRCYGYAVDSRWAITIGPTEKEKYVLHNSGYVVAKGTDVDSFVFDDEDVENSWTRWRNAHD